jgi:hypothetical protein
MEINYILPLTELKEDIPLFFIISFIAHLAKGNVSFCHHLASVIC